MFPVKKLKTVDFVGAEPDFALELSQSSEEVLELLDSLRRKVFLHELGVEQQAQILENFLSQLKRLIRATKSLLVILVGGKDCGQLEQSLDVELLELEEKN